MIPTLFGVTLVTFCVMSFAPGDPIKSSGGGEGTMGADRSDRQNYLIRKREFALDKPRLLNFEWFYDYQDELEHAAWILTASQEELVAELEAMNETSKGDFDGYLGWATWQLGALPGEWTPRQRFIARLGVAGFRRDVAYDDATTRLANAAKSYTTVYCEDLGDAGVGDAVALLESHEDDDRLRRGLIRALRNMAAVDVSKTLSDQAVENDDAAQIEIVRATWSSWHNRLKDSFAPIAEERRAELETQFQAMLNAESREAMQRFALDELFVFEEDLPFFYEKLTEEGATVRQIDAASSVLSMNVANPMQLDAPDEAPPEILDEAAENWRTYVASQPERYDPGVPARLAYIVGDTQYARMASRLVTFQFGKSMVGTRDDVSEKLWEAFLVSAPIMLLAQIVIYAVTIPLGVACGANRESWFDRLTGLALFFLYSVPPAVAAMLALLAFSYRNSYRDEITGGPLFPMERLHGPNAESMRFLPWLADYAWHATLPVICLSLFSLAMMAMYSRASILDVLNQDYVRTARAKGASSRRVLWKHAFRNALIPILTLFANFLPALLGGSVLVEVIFNIPGLGRLGYESIELKDYPTVMALIYVDAIVVMLSILLTDILYVFADPRISFEGRRT